MEFYPTDSAVPDGLTTGDVVLRPLRACDTEADYEALMSSKKMLRVWDQSDWPADDFTLEENRSDLEEHESAHEAGRAFTYTVVDQVDNQCVGCVYIYPLESILKGMGAGDDELADVGNYEAYVTFWVRESELACGLEGRIFDNLVNWFNSEWSFTRVAFGTNTEDTRQTALLTDAGFTPRWNFAVPGRDTEYLVYRREQR